MRRQNQAMMFARVDEWEKSPMSMEDFAQTTGISKSTFKYWVRKARETVRTADDCPQFIEMGSLVSANELQESKNQSEILVTPQIVLTFPSGLCLKIYG